MKTPLLPAAISIVSLLVTPQARSAEVKLVHDDANGRLQVLIDGAEALVYQYGATIDLPHYFPIRSPSGKLLTTQIGEPYPHHRSFWFADTVQLAGQPAPTSLYFAFYSQAEKEPILKGPYRDRVRHVKFLSEDVAGDQATIVSQLVWEGDFGKLPIMDEVRRLRIVLLGKGEYFLDCNFEVTAAYGDVTFRTDDPSHYAWPFIRMHPQFAGVITNSEGGVGEEATYMKPARWVDFSGTVAGKTEGLTIFTDPRQPPPKFFTRGYGTFGPHRPDAQDGNPFPLSKGKSLQQRVGILVHDGDMVTGQVKQRYTLFSEGKL